MRGESDGYIARGPDVWEGPRQAKNKSKLDISRKLWNFFGNA